MMTSLTNKSTLNKQKSTPKELTKNMAPTTLTNKSSESQNTKVGATARDVVNSTGKMKDVSAMNKQMTVFREYRGALQRAELKQCKKVITIKYYEWNEKHKEWEKNYSDEKIPFNEYYNIEDCAYYYMFLKNKWKEYKYLNIGLRIEIDRTMNGDI